MAEVGRYLSRGSLAPEQRAAAENQSSPAEADTCQRRIDAPYPGRDCHLFDGCRRLGSP